MKFNFYSPIYFEPWDWRTPDETGIGGSETAICELTRRLALRGHEVTSYAPIRDDCPRYDLGRACWRPLEAVDWDADGVWVLSRCPMYLDRLPRRHGRQVWLVAQDVDYPNPDHALTSERCANLDRLLALCPTHVRYMEERYPHLKGKVALSTNGIRVDKIKSIELCNFVSRVPRRIIWTGSPDRGLIRSLEIFRRAREFEPDLEFVACYGLDNINKCDGSYWREVERRVRALADQPGVTFIGRLPQPALYDAIRSAGLWVYCTDFQETSCVSCMEAMALGAIPVFSPVWALNDNIAHGIAIMGEPDELLTRAKFLHAVLRLVRDPEAQESIRREMMVWARERFDWERVTDQYEQLAKESTTVNKPCDRAESPDEWRAATVAELIAQLQALPAWALKLPVHCSYDGNCGCTSIFGVGAVPEGSDSVPLIGN